jgi:hypothetical protein
VHILALLRETNALKNAFRIHMAALDHAIDFCVNAHDPNNTMDMAMPKDTSPNVRKITDQILRTTSNNGEVFPENNAMACIIAAAGWLACVDDTKHADEFISDLSNTVADLAHQTREGSFAVFEKASTPPSEH